MDPVPARTLPTHLETRGLWLGVVGLSLLAGCLGSLTTKTVPGPCGSPDGGSGCLTLAYYPTASVHSGASSVKGTLNWGLYKGGDVDLFGPGDNASLYGSAIPVDFGDPGDNPTGKLDGGPGQTIEFDCTDGGVEVDIEIQGIPAESYQALGYLDIHGSGESSGGDPVTLPSSEFTVVAGELLRVEVPLDYIR